MTINEQAYYGYGLISGFIIIFVFWAISKRNIRKTFSGVKRHK